jgi:hypothetical protein
VCVDCVCVCVLIVAVCVCVDCFCVCVCARVCLVVVIFANSLRMESPLTCMKITSNIWHKDLVQMRQERSQKLTHR